MASTATTNNCSEVSEQPLLPPQSPKRDFSRLKELREEVAKNKIRNKPADIQDYYDGIDEKYGY